MLGIHMRIFWKMVQVWADFNYLLLWLFIFFISIFFFFKRSNVGSGFREGRE